ncbi:mucin-2-like isoform X2 [Solea solea]|uniref:mucin-2-like isoform X2 n=1 Tax=Solea solea TaxID=90069 RepID=UPI00272B4442|nr:mucin-2-like isoform X2 [Solea solea]
MKIVLVGVIFGLFTVVRTTPINTVTQIPTKAEDEVLREAVTDGFLVDHFFPSTLSTKSPESNTSKSPVQQPTSSAPEKVDIDEGSGESTTSVLIQHGADHSATTTWSDSPVQSSSTVSTKESTYSSSNPPTNQSPQSSFTSSSVPNEAHSSVTPGHILVSQTTDPAVPSFNFLSTQSSDSGSGDGEDTAPISSVTSISSTETSTASSTSVVAKVHPRLFGDHEGSGSGTTAETSTASSSFTTAPRLFSEPEGSGSSTTVELTSVKKVFVEPRINQFTPEGLKLQEVKEHVTIASPRHGGSTPSWIIILGFIVGVAALVLLCVAIATRDRWNGPNQVSQAENKSDFLNQQRELEMETFLHKEEPRENGKAAEYTVIPLDELPESSLSH